MFFTVAVDLPEGGMFEFSTESILQFLQAVAEFGNGEVVEIEDYEDEGIEIPEVIDHLFAEGEEYTYDEDAECFCWYDAEYDAWYWLNEETGEWLLVEDEAEDEAEEA